MWSNMMKAAWKCSQGDAQDLSLQTCACNLVKVLVNMAGTYTFQGQPAESELVLREALQVIKVQWWSAVTHRVVSIVAIFVRSFAMRGTGFGAHI